MKMNEKDKSFYMFATSDSNLDIYPDNKCSDFTILFEKAINFEEKYECSLHEIILPKFNPIINFEMYVVATNYNLRSGAVIDLSKHILYTISIGTETIKSKEDFILKFLKTVEKYFSSQFLRNIIFEKFPELSDKRFRFTEHLGIQANKSLTEFTVINGKVMDWGETRQLSKELLISIYFDKNISKFLGIPDNFVLPEGETTIIRRVEPGTVKGLMVKESWHWKISKQDLSQVISDSLTKNISIYLLANIISESYINDKKYPYMRLIHCYSNGKSVFKFEPPIYYPIKYEYFNSINFKIVDLNFGEVYFENGTAIVIIHFRKI